jgi:hypothetical protein
MNRIDGFILQGSIDGSIDHPEGYTFFARRNGVSGKHIKQVQAFDQGFAELATVSSRRRIRSS